MPLRRATALVAVFAAGTTVSAQDSAPRTLTLKEAVDLALLQNDRIHAAADAVEDARLALRTAQAAFRPTFAPRILGALGNADGLSSQSYGFDLTQRFPTGTELQASVGTFSSRNQLGSFYYSDTTLSIAQPILGGGGADSARRQVESAERSIDTAIGAHEAARQTVAIEVAAAFYAIVAQQQTVDVAAKAVERSAHLLAVSEAKLEIGKVSQLDVLRARQLAREAESHLLDARAVAEDAADRLRLLTGLTLQDQFVIRSDIAARVDTAGLEVDVAVATERSAAVQRARQALAAAEAAARAARRPALPRVDFKVALTRRETGDTLRSSLGLNGFRVVPFLGISMPVDRGAAGGADASALDVARKERELRAAEMRAEIDLRRAMRNHQRFLHSLASANDSVTFAASQVDVARVRFERGLSGNLELVSAEADLLAAQSRRSSVAAALAVARLEVKAAMGSLDLEKDFERQP